MSITHSEAMELGWSIVPVKLNKKPHVPWRTYQNTRTTADMISKWDRQFKPAAWAVVTGGISGIIVLDFDGEPGRATLESLGLDPHVRTGSGGFHVYFQHPGHTVKTVNSKSKRELGESYPGLDIRADGGYAIFTGSNAAGSYVWLREAEPYPVSVLPHELRVSLGLEPTDDPGQSGPDPADATPFEAHPGAGEYAVQNLEASDERDSGSFLALPVEGDPPSIDTLVDGALDRSPDGRNDAGFWLACQLRDNGYDEDEARSAMLTYQARAGQVNRNGQPEPYRRKEALDSLAQAYLRTPREQWATAGDESTVVVEKDPPESPPSRKPAKSKAAKSVAAKLLAIGSEAAEDLFHTPEGEAYVSFFVDGTFQTHPLDSRAFRDRLRNAYMDRFQAAPTQEAVRTVVEQLGASARACTDTREVHVRLAQLGGKIYLDLVNDRYEGVEIDADGWRVISRPPVRFVRGKGALPLPMPQGGGSLADLYELVNLSKGNFILLVAYMVGAMQVDVPYPVLVVSGEQGSAKSTVCRIVKQLIDPNTVPLRIRPREDREVLITAASNHIIAYDNVSYLPDWLSDVIAALATGVGYGTRELFTNHSEAILSAKRPVILNGITDFVERSDLLDRSLLVVCDPIDDDRRMTADVFWKRFEAIRPRLLGALLDAVSAALRNLPNTKLKRLPRMADFALWVSAAEEVLPWESGTFLRFYEENRSAANHLAIEGNLVAEGLVEFMKDKDAWEGRISELFHLLATETPPERFPRDATRLSGQLRRLSPNLRQIGLQVDISRTKSGSRVTITGSGDAGDAGDASSSIDESSLFVRSGSEEEREERDETQANTIGPTASPASPASFPTKAKRRVRI